MQSRNHLFGEPIGTSAADTSAVDTRVVDTPVADRPAVAAGWLIVADFEDHLAQRHNLDRHLKFFCQPHNKHKKPSVPTFNLLDHSLQVHR